MTRAEKHEQLIAGFGRVAYSPAEAAIASDRSRSRIFLAIKTGQLVARKDGRATLMNFAAGSMVCPRLGAPNRRCAKMPRRKNPAGQGGATIAARN
jgi:hypothetical protein